MVRAGAKARARVSVRLGLGLGLGLRSVLGLGLGLGLRIRLVPKSHFQHLLLLRICEQASLLVFYLSVLSIGYSFSIVVPAWLPVVHFSAT